MVSESLCEPCPFMLIAATWAVGARTGKLMTFKIILIALTAAAFGWGFSALVEHADQTIRPDNPPVACTDRAGEGCARMPAP